MSRPKKKIHVRADLICEIPLKKGFVALIDIEDLPLAEHYGWVLDDTKPNLYVHTCAGKLRKTLKLHRFLMGAVKGQIVDHINGNGLDNRRENLRFVSASQNSANRRKKQIKTSKYKGVHKRENGRWRAAIRVNRKLINLGTFHSELEAALVYNAAALSYFGEFACINQWL